MLNDTLQTSLERVGAGDDMQTVRDTFVRTMGRVAQEEGMGPLPSGLTAGGIEDISSATRLKLIFDTLTRSAFGFAAYSWQHRHQTDYPAARFIRHPGAKVKRPLHEENENQVRPFADTQWWIYMNNRELGGFEVPWPPYGFNSYMDREPLSRNEALALGLKADALDRPAYHIGFNDRLSVDVSGMPWRILRRLRRAFKGQVTYARKAKRLIFHPKSSVRT